MATMREVVVAVFDDPDLARDAISALKDAGFSGSDISVLMPDRDQTRAMAEDTGTEAGAGAATGLVAGGLLGGMTGWLVGIGALAIPGVGPFIAAGALGAALTGAAIGAGVGAIAGALVGMGVPEEEAGWYEGEVKGGRTLVTVRAGARDDVAEDILHDYGAYDVNHQSAGSYTPRSTWSRGTAGAASMSGTTPVSSRTVITASGTSPVTGGSSSDSGSSWDTAAPRFRSDWQQRYGTSGAGWSEYEPRYRYGWEMANRPEYRGRSWMDAEPDLRRDYEGRYGQSTWDDVKDTIRDAWDSVAGQRTARY